MSTQRAVDRDHARRYRALLACARIRAVGMAGFDTASRHRVGQGENFRHLGLDMWSIHVPSEDTEEERRNAATLMHEFTDKVLALQDPSVEELPNFEKAFEDLTHAMLAKMHRCDKNDPEELAVHHALQSLLVRYGCVQLPPCQQPALEPA